MSGVAPRRFDDPAAPSALAVAGRLLRSHRGTVLAFVAASAILTFIAAACLLVVAGGVEALEAAVAATPIAVAVGTDADVQALGAAIRARPDVATATLRAKEDGLRALMAAGLPSPDGRNPLPDVWIVTMAPGPIVRGERPLADSVSTLRSALGRLPNVDAVRVDDRYVARIDAITTGWLRLTPGASFGLLIALGVVLACLSFVAGGALTMDRRPATSVWPLTFVAAVAALLANLVGIAAVYGVATSAFAAVGEHAETLLAAARFAPTLALLCVATVLIGAAGAALGALRIDSES